MSTQYKIISSPRLDRIEDTVTGLLNEGWELSGGPFISQSGGMAQAMLLKDPPMKKPAKVGPK